MTTDTSQPSGIALALVDGLLTQPVGKLVPAERLVSVLRQVGLLHLQSAQAEQLAQMIWQRVQGLLAGPGSVRSLLPPPVIELLAALLSRSYVLPRPLLIALLSRPPLRRLSRELMIGTLLDYSRKVRTQVGEASQTRGGMLGRLATEAVKKSTSALGSIAPGMTAAVSDELERQFRTRSSEFADSAVDDLAQRIATILTDPTRQHEHRELARSLLDFALDLPVKTLQEELTKLDPLALSALVRKSLHTWLQRPESEAELLHLSQQLLLGLPELSLADVLGEAIHPLHKLLHELLLAQLASLLPSPARQPTT